MKKIFFLSIVTYLLISLSSCSTSSNLMHNQNQNQTSVVLSQGNYKIIGTAKGTVKNTYVLGIGGLSKKSLRENAVGNMMKNADLNEGSKAVINTNITEKAKYITPFYIQRIVTAESNIIEFTK